MQRAALPRRRLGVVGDEILVGAGVGIGQRDDEAVGGGRRRSIAHGALFQPGPERLLGVERQLAPAGCGEMDPVGQPQPADLAVEIRPGGGIVADVVAEGLPHVHILRVQPVEALPDQLVDIGHVGGQAPALHRHQADPPHRHLGLRGEPGQRDDALAIGRLPRRRAEGQGAVGGRNRLTVVEADHGDDRLRRILAAENAASVSGQFR
nr:hypothetical protein [Methylobrevis pamukkalensis]